MAHYTELGQVPAGYEHVYISPHFDDVVLSCGGSIARHTAAGRRVLVVTLCTAIPTRAQFGPLAEEFHGQWSLGPDEAVTARMHEDQLAMQRVGADSLWVGITDSIYRLPFGYDTRERLFSTPRPDDPLYAELFAFFPALREHLPQATFYAPLGIGYHADHQIVFTVATACAGSLLAYYDDIPYALRPGEVERRLADLGRRYVASTVDIGATLARKIGAIDSYASQVPELFGGSEQMARAITAHAESLRPDGSAYGERFWMRAPEGVAA